MKKMSLNPTLLNTILQTDDNSKQHSIEIAKRIVAMYDIVFECWNTNDIDFDSFTENDLEHAIRDVASYDPDAEYYANRTNAGVILHEMKAGSDTLNRLQKISPVRIAQAFF